MSAYDVVVVGAGPAGATAARAAALGGARTLLVDRREALGVPVQCGEFLPAPAELLDLFSVSDIAREAYRIPSETICSVTHRMACVAPNGRRFLFPLEGQTVSRNAFDARLAHDAEAAGAELRHPEGIVRVRGGEVQTARGERIDARVVIGADGPLSVVARGAGFAPTRTMFRMITATSAGADPSTIELYFGRFAPGGYAWSFPKGSEANIGLGVTELRPGTSLGGLLEEFAREVDLASPTDLTRWWVPIGPPPESAVRGVALFAGDAANLVMATNGGGIPTALLSGWDAGTVAAEHVRSGLPLGEYDRRWKAHLYAPLARAYRIYRLGARIAGYDILLSLGMGYIGALGLDAMMRLRWPRRLGGAG